jgi:hypothetical protein
MSTGLDHGKLGRYAALALLAILFAFTWKSQPVAAAEQPAITSSASVLRPLDDAQSTCETTIAKAKANNVTDDISKICKRLLSVGNALSLSTTQINSMVTCAQNFIAGTQNANPDTGSTVNSCANQSCVDYLRPFVVANGNPLRTGLPALSGGDSNAPRGMATSDFVGLCKQLLTSAVTSGTDNTGDVIACLGRGFQIDIGGNTDVQKMVSRCQSSPSLKDPTDRSCANSLPSDPLRALLDGQGAQTCSSVSASGCTWNLAGTWTIDLGHTGTAGSGRIMHATLNLQQNGTTITGTAMPDAAQGIGTAAKPVKGSVSGSTVTLYLPWNYQDFGPPLSGSPDGDKFTGVIDRYGGISDANGVQWTIEGSIPCVSNSSTSNSGNGPSNSTGGPALTGPNSLGSSGPSGSNSGSTTSGNSGGSATSSTSSSGSGVDSGCIDLVVVQVCVGP